MSRTHNPDILLEHLGVLYLERRLLLNQLPPALVRPLLWLDLMRGVKGGCAFIVANFKCFIFFYFCPALSIHFHAVRVYLEAIKIGHLTLLSLVDILVKLGGL